MANEKRTVDNNQIAQISGVQLHVISVENYLIQSRSTLQTYLPGTKYYYMLETILNTETRFKWILSYPNNLPEMQFYINR